MVSRAGGKGKEPSSASNGWGANWQKREGGERRGAEEEGRRGSNGNGSLRQAAAGPVSKLWERYETARSQSRGPGSLMGRVRPPPFYPDTQRILTPSPEDIRTSPEDPSCSTKLLWRGEVNSDP